MVGATIQYLQREQFVPPATANRASTQACYKAACYKAAELGTPHKPANQNGTSVTVAAVPPADLDATVSGHL